MSKTGTWLVFFIYPFFTPSKLCFKFNLDGFILD